MSKGLDRPYHLVKFINPQVGTESWRQGLSEHEYYEMIVAKGAQNYDKYYAWTASQIETNILYLTAEVYRARTMPLYPYI